MTFAISNHEYASAGSVNAAVRYVAPDTTMTMWAGRDGLALEFAALDIGASVDLPRCNWSGNTYHGPITVTRTA